MTFLAVAVVFILLAHFDARADELREELKGVGREVSRELDLDQAVAHEPSEQPKSEEAEETKQAAAKQAEAEKPVAAESSPSHERSAREELAREEPHAEDRAREEPARIETAVAPHAKPPAPPGWLSRTVAAFRAAIRAFDEKLSETAHLDQQNTALRERVAVLETQNSAFRQRDDDAREAGRAQKLRAEAVADGGVPGSRTLASLQAHELSGEALASKPPKTVFDIAMKAFAKGDFETSAVALVALVDNSENDSYRTAQAYYLTGVSLYEVANYKRAIAYFSRTDLAAKGGDETYAPRALAWKALCYAKLGDECAQSATIRLLIQRYPRSKEARRLNRNESS